MKHWYALQVKPRHEKVVASSLRSKCYEEFLPLRNVRRRWSDRLQTIELPLLPGYTFCRFDLPDRAAILRTPGLLRIVGVGGVPAAVLEEEIAALQTITRVEIPAVPHPYLQSGQRIRLDQGPLSGLSGLMLQTTGRQRLVVSVTLLQRSVAVEVEQRWISPESLAGSPASAPFEQAKALRNHEPPMSPG